MLTLFLLLHGLNEKIWGAVKVVLLCVIVTETEMLEATPLTKLYSGIQCYIYTHVKGLGKWMCKYMLMYSLIHVGIVYIKRHWIYSLLYISLYQFCAALAMQYWCWKCLDNSLCLKMYSQVSFWMFLLNITKIYSLTLHCHH